MIKTKKKNLKKLKKNKKIKTKKSPQIQKNI